MERRRKWVTPGWVMLLMLPMGGWQLLSGDLVAGTPAAPQTGLGYGVNSTGDGDNVGSSSFCDDGTGHCTLRAAIQASNQHPGADFIGIVIPASDPGCDANGDCIINLPRALPDLTEGVSISGPGAAHLTVRRDTGGNYRIFNVTATGTVTLSGMTISNGSEVRGGGIQNQGSGTVNVSDDAFSANTASIEGGGIDNFSTGTVNVTNSTFSGNSAAFSGGGVANGDNFNSIGTVNISNSTLNGNSATDLGGAIFNKNAGLVNIVGCTLSGNAAAGSGGVENYTNGTVNITNSTLNGNLATSSSGGGIYNNAGTLNVRSSIVALNTSGPMGPEVYGSFATGGFNLIGITDGSTGFTSLSDLTGTIAAPLDPKLDPAGLRNNGGPTQTIALLFGSPAIDKGTSNGLTGQLTTDQRGAGFPRIFDDPGIGNALGGDDTDIGAFELQTAAPTLLANISTRLRVETGDNVLIGGFIVTGTQPKKVIVRAIGPSLPLAGALADPILELHGPEAFVTVTNDNWRSDQEAEIIATTIAPGNDFESAIVATLPANNSAYTAIVHGLNGGTGIGLVEAYDLDRTVDSKLANISTRGFVETGDNVLIAGTIVLGGGTQRVIVRAIGPSLNVSGKLADPTLELRDDNGGLIRSNDNWRTDQEAEIIATTIPPTNDLESAIVATLPANGASYTAIVRGVNDTSGVALVEVYALN